MKHINPKGFVQIPNEIMAYTVLSYSEDKAIHVTPATLGVYWALFQHRKTDPKSEMKGCTWVSQERLAVELGTSRNTVSKHINILIRVGLITKTKKHSGQNVFNVYRFKKPLNPEQLKKKYPSEFEAYEKAIKKIYEPESVEVVEDDDSEYI